MFRKKSIDEWSLKYWLTQRYVNPLFRLYFRRFVSVGRSNIPDNAPVILASNHQNALIDALLFETDSGYQPVFLARADIFKGRWITRILTVFNIMPIFRIRDGISKVRKNDEVFDKSLQVLYNGHNPLCLFPEGNHGDKRRLRPLVKGLFRIALMAQEKFGESAGVKILPVGFDYSHYQKFRSTVFINYGKPIEVSEYFRLWSDNPVEAINQLRDRFAEEIKKLMIHIETEEYYDLYMNLRTIYNAPMRKHLGIQDGSLAGRFRADKKMIELLDGQLEKKPEDLYALNGKMNAYQQLLHQFNFRDWVIEKGRFPWYGLLAWALLLLLAFPVFLYGFLVNIFPFYFPVYFTRKKIKDIQFHSSVKFVLALILFPLTHLVWLIPGFLLIDPTWMRLAFFLSLPLSGMLAFFWSIHFKKCRSRFRLCWMNLTRNPVAARLKDSRNEILDHMNLIVKQNI